MVKSIKKTISIMIAIVLVISEMTILPVQAEVKTYTVGEIVDKGSQKVNVGDVIQVRAENMVGGYAVRYMKESSSYWMVNGVKYYSNYDYTIPECDDGYYWVVSFVQESEINEVVCLRFYIWKEPMITGVQITSSDSVEIGKNIALTAVVNGTQGCSQEVKWSIVGEHDESTYIDNNSLYVSPVEKNSSITVKAVSVGDGDYSSTKEITITKPVISGIEVTPVLVSADKGTEVDVSANVLGDNDPVNIVFWEIENNTSDKTVIKESTYNSCKLFISEDEKAKVILVKAYSPYSDKYAYCTVNIITPPPVVEKVVLNKQDIHIEQGKTDTVEAEVEGLYEPSQEIEWSILNNTSENTTVVGNVNQATVKIGKDETAEFIILVATSVQDNTKLATMKIYIDKTSEEEKPIDDEKDDPDNKDENKTNEDNKTETNVDDKTVKPSDEKKENNKTEENIVTHSVGAKISDKKYSYKVTKEGSTDKAITGEVEVTGLKKKSLTTVKIAKQVTIDGITYNVTSIAKKAFKNNKKIKKVMIGKNVKNIGASAFDNCKKLKRVVINTTVLKKIGKKAFYRKKGKKITFKVPKTKKKAYKKILKRAKTNKYKVK